MRNILSFSFLALLTVGLFGGCTNKKLEIEIYEVACKNVRISNAQHRYINNPSCGSNEVTRTISVDFNFPVDKIDCIKKVKVDAKFYDYNGSLLNGTLINYTDDLYEIGSNPNVSVIGNTINFKLCYTFPSAADTATLNHLRVFFHTENEIENKSNELSLLIYRPGAPLNPASYTIKETMYVTNGFVSMRVWDDAAEDGDIISLNINGEWVLQNHLLTNAGHFFNRYLSPGENIIVMLAVNLGDSPPNTGALSIFDGVSTQQVILNSDIGSSEAIRVIW